METQADLAIVVGGYNSSNTSHLVELLEQKFPCYFIKDAQEIRSKDEIQSFDIHTKSMIAHESFLPQKEKMRIILTSGASCPDSIVDAVMMKLLSYYLSEAEIKTLLSQL